MRPRQMTMWKIKQRKASLLSQRLVGMLVVVNTGSSLTLLLGV